MVNAATEQGEAGRTFVQQMQAVRSTHFEAKRLPASDVGRNARFENNLL